MDSVLCNCFIQSSEHCFIEKYIRVARPHRSMTRHRLDGTRMYYGQHQTLMFVSDDPNVPQKGLARIYGASGAAIAVSPEKPEKGGHIRCLIDQKDNRHNRIYIMDKDRRMVEDSAKIFRRVGYCMFEGFSGNDMRMLEELLDRIYGSSNQEFTGRTQGEES